jgi:hypothetical protein
MPAAAAAAAVLLAGCASSSFAHRADAICARDPTLQREIADLRRLGPRADPLVRALAHEVVALRILRIASFSGDSEEAQSALYQGRQARRTERAAARQLGLRVCGR